MTIDAGGGQDAVQVTGTLIMSLIVRGGTDSVSDSLVIDDRTFPTNMFGGSVYADRISRAIDEPTPSNVYYSGFSYVDWYRQDSQNVINVFGVSGDISPNNQVWIGGGTSNDSVDVYPRDTAGNPTILGNLSFSGRGSADWLNVITKGTDPAGYRVFEQFGLNDVFIGGAAIGERWIGATTAVENVTVQGGAGNDHIAVEEFNAGTALAVYGGGEFDVCTFGARLRSGAA